MVGTPHPAPATVLTESQARQFLPSLERRGGFDVVSLPKMTRLSESSGDMRASRFRVFAWFAYFAVQPLEGRPCLSTGSCALYPGAAANLRKTACRCFHASRPR
jgi:hypothetical protein